MTQSEFLDKLYRLSKEDVEKLFCHVFDYFADTTLYIFRLTPSDEKFKEWNETFVNIDPERVSVSAIVALVRSSYPAREELPNRRIFMDRVKNKVIASKGLEKAEKIYEEVY